MGDFLIILLIFVSVAGIDIPGIIKKKQWEELAVFVTFFSAAFAITTLHYVFHFDFSVISVWFINVFSLWP